MQRSRSPASSCCTAFGRDSSNCDVSAFKIKLHLQSGTPCFEPESALRSKDCLLVLVTCTRALATTRHWTVTLSHSRGKPFGHVMACDLAKLFAIVGYKTTVLSAAE